MLEIVKTTQFRGNSKVGTEVAKVFEATVNTTSPENLTMNSYIVNYDLYKLNRAAISAEQIEFEDAVYAFQESLMTA